jgi:molecular chaperone GrpE
MSKRRHNDPDPVEQTEGGQTGPDAAESSADAGAAPDVEPAPEVVVEELPSVEDALRRERDEAQDKWLRAVAEMDNLRKRTRREVTDAHRFAKADALRGFLDVLDNLERALQSNAASTDTGAPDAFRDGIELIRQRLRGVLQEQGVTTIEAMGLHLDPAVHEAVGQLPREGSESGTIIEVAQPGYKLGELVLRPARVIICA